MAKRKKGDKSPRGKGRGPAAEPALVPLALEPLPLGAIRPAGWLARQLRIQADGLTGHLDEFWPDVKNSGWFGGEAEGWERAPYWLDGLVPLVFLLDDEGLKEKARRHVGYIIDHQHDDGWLGPQVGKQIIGGGPSHDPWPVMIVLKAMTQYAEATGDPRVAPAMQKCLRRMSALLDEHNFEHWGKPGASSWAATRYADLLVSIYWLHARTGEGWLVELAGKAHNAAFDWRKHFRDFQYTQKIKWAEMRQWTHVVNNAMAIKQPGVLYRLTKDPADRAAAHQFMETLDRWHGQVTGLFTGDEHYATKNPSQGTETCAVVEYLFSLEVLASILGDPAVMDRLERIAFNALPAPFKPDMWARQYDQEANQVLCAVTDPPVWGTNGKDAGIFGVGSAYGCCTANMHQGWPKFAAHLWMRLPASEGAPRGGLAALTYAPCVARTKIGDANVEVEVVTEYPFDDRVEIRVRTDRAARFPLALRIPGWTQSPGISFAVSASASDSSRVPPPNSQPAPSSNSLGVPPPNLFGGVLGGGSLEKGSGRPTPGTLHCLHAEWPAGETTLTLTLPMAVRVERRYHNSAAILRGPLVYSLKVGDDWRPIGGMPDHPDYEVHPTTPWNYALELDAEHPERSVSFERRPLGECPFSPEGAPVVAKAKGRRVPEWGLERGAAGPLPESPVRSDEPLEELTLVPYGCANLRVTEFPVLG